jgi:predicted ATPase
VSLLGIGGCGKTRAAMRFGWTHMGDFPGGIWFCDLAPARTVEGLYSAVAQGLDVPLGQEDPLHQLGSAIAGRGACLVVLDNFEQLARHAEGTVGRWLERAGAARFLVTSREVLGIAGEETVFLAPMVSDDAQALFMRRAAAARRDFHPTPEDLAAIAPLVKLLDGLPLAIELAAARVRTLPPRALLARMSERFKLLASSGGRLDRQATLRAAFDWSWDLLAPHEKSALAQLAVFHGNFALDAAEEVIDLSRFAGAPWPLDVVQSLVDKSFVRALPLDRFDLLGSVQAYALERLQAADLPLGTGPQAWRAAQQRHGGYFAALGPQRATQQQAADLDNLVAACQWAVSAQQGDLASGALDGAWAALALRGPFKAGIDLAQALCALPQLQHKAAAHAFAVLGQSLTAAGRRAEAAPAFETALARAKAAGDLACESAVRSSLAALHARQGRTWQALSEHEQALRGARLAGDAALECAALNGLGALAFGQGQMNDARSHWEAVLQLAEQAGLKRWQCTVLGNLSSLHANQGRMTESLRQGEVALTLARELGDRQREGNTLCNLGLLYVMQGRLADAGHAGHTALQVGRDLGDARLECVALCNLGLVHHAAAESLPALARFESALALSRQTRDRRAEGQILGYMGLSLARLGEPAAGAEKLAAGEEILTELQDPLSLGLLLCCLAESQALRGAGDSGAAGAARAVQRRAQDLAKEAGAGPESELGLALAQLERRLAGAITPS